MATIPIMTSTSTLAQVSSWISHTSLSALMQQSEWTIPSIQTVHILSIAAATSTAFLVDLRLLGIVAQNRPTYVIARRLRCWGRAALVLLALSGSLLVVAEPGRSLTNVVFGVKLLVLAAALLSNWALERGLCTDPRYWEHRPTRAMGRVIAVMSMLLWAGVVLAGRLIAYIGA